METSNVIVSSRIRLARNLKNLPFTHKFKDAKDADEVISIAEKAFNKIKAFSLYKMKDADEIKRIALVEKHLISKELAANTVNGALMLSADESTAVMLNEEDHFRIQSIKRGFALDEAYADAHKLDIALASTAMLAYSDTYGYLTACPSNVGTGLRASVMLFLPALTATNSISSVIVAVQKMGLTVRGIFGEGSKADGCMYQLSNQISLGITEEEILESVKSVAKTIEKSELEARQLLLNRQGVALKDKLSRSYGILKTAYVMSSKELRELVTNVKLAVSLNILDVDEKLIDEISTDCQPANITLIAGRNMNDYERDVMRAKYIREKLN